MNDSEPTLERGQLSTDVPWGGDPLWSTLKFLAIPGLLAVAITAFGVRLPGIVLYGVAGVVAIALFLHTIRDPEWLLAITAIYLPLNKLFVVPIAPGVNGTNGVLVLLIFAWFLHRHRTPEREQGAKLRPPAAKLVRAYAFVTVFSIVTALFTLGTSTVFGDIFAIKAWLDQFIVFFTFLGLVRDGNMARRIMVYMMLGSAVVLALGFQEWLDKRWLSSIDKARLLGPHLQPNDFGAFLAYSSAPFLALLMNNIRRVRIWLLTVPYLLPLAKILLATFSRGAYLGMAFAGLIAGYVRGKLFLAGSALLGLALLVAMPELIPDSLMARMSQTSNEEVMGEELDKSSQTRLILWNAALDMTAQSPVFGWGFRSFPRLKSEFTEEPVHESDNHNMYLYLSSQMGVPAVVLFGLILWRMYSLGVRVYRQNRQPFARVIGMSACALVGATALINMFGSRMVDICVTVYFWITLALVARLSMEVDKQKLSSEGKS